MTYNSSELKKELRKLLEYTHNNQVDVANTVVDALNEIEDENRKAQEEKQKKLAAERAEALRKEEKDILLTNYRQVMRSQYNYIRDNPKDNDNIFTIGELSMMIALVVDESIGDKWAAGDVCDFVNDIKTFCDKMMKRYTSSMNCDTTKASSNPALKSNPLPFTTKDKHYNNVLDEFLASLDEIYKEICGHD